VVEGFDVVVYRQKVVVQVGVEVPVLFLVNLVLKVPLCVLREVLVEQEPRVVVGVSGAEVLVEWVYEAER
jgi:hypothetical protein